MTRLIDLIQTENAVDFKEEVNRRMTINVAESLDALKVEVAQNFFSEEPMFMKRKRATVKTAMKSAQRKGVDPYDSHKTQNKSYKKIVADRARRKKD